MWPVSVGWSRSQDLSPLTMGRPSSLRAKTTSVGMRYHWCPSKEARQVSAALAHLFSSSWYLHIWFSGAARPLATGVKKPCKGPLVKLGPS